jgi:hypothetical protein
VQRDRTRGRMTRLEGGHGPSRIRPARAEYDAERACRVAGV